ncbi:MAG TPA: WhiB family transcriptional regulator [Streptosporangiaceae bacterium]|jgi:WhiB family redox-sensing transcriptional regulator
MYPMTATGFAKATRWAARGACRGSDPELFFPIAHAGPAASQLAKARAICAQCPVQRECLEFAVESGQDFGVWGGMSEGERRVLRRKQSRHRRYVATRR